MSEPQPATRNKSLSLSIAGLGIRLMFDNAALAEALKRRYRDFPAHGAARLEAVVTLNGRQRASTLLDYGVAFREGVLHFNAPGYSGFVDVRAGQAQLSLSSVQPVEEVDYFLRAVYALLAFEAGGLLFHAAGIIRNGKVHVFFGHSGAGKTTVARSSPDDTILNDDLIVLLPPHPRPLSTTWRGETGGEGWTVHATPFWNPTQVSPSARSAPLAGLYRLTQAKRVFLEKMSRARALAESLSNVPVIPDDPARRLALLERCEGLLTAVPAYRLHFLPDDSFWEVVESVTADESTAKNRFTAETAKRAEN